LRKIYIDTGAFYALIDSDDQFHQISKSVYENEIKTDHLITSLPVFIETFHLIHHKIGKPSAIKFWKVLKNSSIILINIDLVDLEFAFDIINKYSDQNFSVVDCLSFSIIERLKIDLVFTFDSHFKIYKPSISNKLNIIPSIH